jgi:ssRNA-specific RNase YbeY (16S rRNA maturation enzyme)
VFRLERVIYHGVLHLCGYDDKTDDEISVMREKEKYYLECDVSRET